MSGPYDRGDRASYRVTQVVRNSSTTTLILHAQQRSAPGMTYVRTDIIPGAAAHAATDEATGDPLHEWFLPPGAEVFLTYIYRLRGDSGPGCLSPPVDQWRAPVYATDTARHLVTVADEPTQAPQVPQAWVGGWRVRASQGCSRPVRVGKGAPFLVFTGQAASTQGGTKMGYAVTAYGLPGEPPATVTGARMVGAFAGRPAVITSRQDAIHAGQTLGLMLEVPIRCPPPGVPVTLALSYRVGSVQASAPVLVELRTTPVDTGQLC